MEQKCFYHIILFYDMKQKGDDYKLTSVKYYLNNDDTMDNTCNIFIVKNRLYTDGLSSIKRKKI